MNNILWITVPLAPLRDIPIFGNRLCNVPQFSRVHAMGEERILEYEGKPQNFIRVRYQPNEKQVFEGWIYGGSAETYYEEFKPGVVKINTATLNPADLEQYIVWEKQVQ